MLRSVTRPLLFNAPPRLRHSDLTPDRLRFNASVDATSNSTDRMNTTELSLWAAMKRSDLGGSQRTQVTNACNVSVVAQRLQYACLLRHIDQQQHVLVQQQLHQRSALEDAMAGQNTPVTGQQGRHGDSIHEQAERIAVPAYDWIGEPIAAIADALFELTDRHHHHNRADSRTTREHG
jgi:hypothetical protein